VVDANAEGCHQLSRQDLAAEMTLIDNHIRIYRC